MSRLVLAHGCFDLLHLGHIRHLQEARALGDKLVVSITSDRFVNKGLGRPRFNAEQRAEALRALECVDEVVINDDRNAIKLINELRPAVYVKGVDYDGSADADLAGERAAVESGGGVIHFTKSEKWSSSQLINADRFSVDVLAYLAGLKKSGALSRILEAFQRADLMNIVVVGETIIDEYRFVRGLGKASKELMIAAVETGSERYEGGAVAASKHGEWPQLRVVTAHESITKTRFVDADFNRKLLDVYSARKIRLSGRERNLMRAEISTAIDSAGCVVVFDFGHGMLTQVERELLWSSNKFLAVNAQSNAGNYGFNLVTKYQQADLICIDDPEARLATSMDEAPIEDVIRHGLMKRVRCPNVLVTHGRNGSNFSVWGQEPFSGHAPAFAAGGVDTMGAGDATLMVVAPLVAAGLALSEAAFVGNIVGALKIGILGHRRHVARDEIIQTIKAVLS